MNNESMKKYIPFIIIILLAVFGVTAFFLFKKPVTAPSEIPDELTPDQTQMVTAQLSLEPQDVSIQSGQETTYSVILTADPQVIGVESYITFDPNIVTVLSIEPAGLFSDPKILADNIDSAAGTIMYTIGSFTPSASQGTVFTIRVRANSPTNAVPFSFDQALTKVALTDVATQKNYSQDETQLNFVEKPLTVLP